MDFTLSLKVEPAVAQTGIGLLLLAVAVAWNKRTKLLSRMFPSQPAPKPKRKAAKP